MDSQRIARRPPQDNASSLMPAEASGHQKHRLAMFVVWLDEREASWIDPDLAAYRDYLLSDERLVQRGSQLVASPLKPSSAQTHLSTIRGRYRALLETNTVRDRLYALTPPDASASDKKAFVDELLIRLENAVKLATAKVKVIVKQDRVDSEHSRLTRAQAGALMAAPRHRAENTPQQALRDTAMLALMLCSGLREMELCGLDVADLRQRVNGELVLRVREGKGAKQRAIPYGSLDWCLSIVDSWMLAAAIEGGPVFRGFYRNGRSVRPGRLTVRAINQTLDKYPIMMDGQLKTVQPHDLRRTYARRLFEAGIAPVVIQQNLGHSDLKTTLGYIGDLEIEQRRPPAIYDPLDLKAYAALV